MASVPSTALTRSRLAPVCPRAHVERRLARGGGRGSGRARRWRARRPRPPPRRVPPRCGCGVAGGPAPVSSSGRSHGAAWTGEDKRGPGGAPMARRARAAPPLLPPFLPSPFGHGVRSDEHGGRGCAGPAWHVQDARTSGESTGCERVLHFLGGFLGPRYSPWVR